MRNTVDDFWLRVDKNAANGCWEWTGALYRDGYGAFSFENKMRKAHRFSAELAGMNITNLFVCHKCDNPKCVNPEHLFPGTSLDNMRDMITKGRARHVNHVGERHGMARVTEDDVRYIRKYFKESPQTYVEWGLKYNVHPSTIRNIVARNTWRHI